MTKRYYKEIIESPDTFAGEVRVRDTKQRFQEFCVWCVDEAHADALVKELNRRGYWIYETNAIKIANELKVQS
jgi:hypothetical protein